MGDVSDNCAAVMASPATMACTRSRKPWSGEVGLDCSGITSPYASSRRANDLVGIREPVQRRPKNLAVFADQRRAVHGAARVGEGAGYADADRVGSAEQRVVVVARGGVALHQHLALEGVALHGVAAGVKQIGVAAEDLSVPEQNHAAALAGASVQQVDVDRIQPVLHNVLMPAAAPAETGNQLCQSAALNVNATGCRRGPIRRPRFGTYRRVTLT